MPHIYENVSENFASFEHFKEVAVKTINEIYGRAKALDIFDFHQHDGKYVCVAHYDGEENVPTAQEAGETPSAEILAAADQARKDADANLQKANEDAEKEKTRLRELAAEGKTFSLDDATLATTLGISDELSAATTARFELLEKHFDGDIVLPIGEREDGYFVFQVMRKDVEVARGSLPELEAQAASEEPHVYADSDEEKIAAAGGVNQGTATGPGETDEDDGNTVISKNAQALADKYNVDISKVIGTGYEGKITSDDINKYLDANPSATAPVTENAPNADANQPTN